MDAKSFHEHQNVTPKQRLGVKSAPVVEISGNEDIEQVANRPIQPELSTPDIEIVETIEPIKPEEPVAEPAETPKAAPASEPADDDDPIAADRPNPWSPEAVNARHYEEQQAYRYASTPIPKQVNRALVEPAKPVRDNANAIILILLIAILLITVAIYAVIVAREDRKSTTIQTITQEKTGDDKGGDDSGQTEHILKETFGVWQTEGRSCYAFTEDNEFYWYETCYSEGGNLHTGALMGGRGETALENHGITYDEAITNTELRQGQVSVNDFYVLDLDTKRTVVGGESRTDNVASFKLIFVKISETEARIYNYKTEKTYHVTRIADTIEEWRASLTPTDE